MLDAIDTKCAANGSFMAWIGKLETLMREWDTKHGNLPYTLPLSYSTGLRVWLDSFEDGMTPQDAFASDRSYWEE